MSTEAQQIRSPRVRRPLYTAIRGQLLGKYYHQITTSGSTVHSRTFDSQSRLIGAGILNKDTGEDREYRGFLV